jgi:hypothetical protein
LAPLPLRISCAGTASVDLLHAAIKAMQELIGRVLSATMIAIGCQMGNTPRMVEETLTGIPVERPRPTPDYRRSGL